MIRVGLFTKELRLSAALASTLGPDFTICSTSFLPEAKSILQGAEVDVWIVDVDNTYDLCRDWSKLLEALEGESARTVSLLVTDEQFSAMETYVEEHGYNLIRKPIAVRELRRLLRKVYEGIRPKTEPESARKNVDAIGGLDQLKGVNARMQTVYDMVRRVTNLDAPVLITGESGTGKELVARAIHNIGPRAHRPFIAISCGAIPETLLEAELFGHEKGAFTGTVTTREGYLEQAGDGTLFLDEIGELSQSAQVKLLRVLQQREFSRLGSSKPIALRARVVFATHRDLRSMVAEGTFRQDLFYRVNVMNIRVPSLRERCDDISTLTHYFVRRYAEVFGLKIESVDPDVLVLLQSYSWPGNVRELENVIQRAVILAEDNRIRIKDLPEAIQALDVAVGANDLPAGSFERLMRDFKLKLVRDALEQNNGNKTLAAQSLCISRAYLHRLIRPTASVDALGSEMPINHAFMTELTQ